MMTPSLVVVDDFLPDPDAVRRLAMSVRYVDPNNLHKGRRSVDRFLDIVKPADVSRLLGGLPIPDWAKHGMNARFQFCTSHDPIVYHTDLQQWAGALYLTPDAPLEAGLSLLKSRSTGLRKAPQDPELAARMYDGNLLDGTKWETVDRVGNVYNRLVLWNGQMAHAASCYFGSTPEDSRLFMIFFFDSV